MDPSHVRRYFAARPDLAPTPLVALPSLARELGLAEVLVKDETHRFGLNAFKIVGVQYAVATLLASQNLRPGGTITCATAGNHGRAVAYVARHEGLKATVYVPKRTAAAAIDAIAAEGAEVVTCEGSYEDAVAQMADASRTRGWTVVSDTSWPGGDDTVPRLIMEGYLRIFDELRGTAQPFFPAIAPTVGGGRIAGLIVVQAGVGGLAAATIAWAAMQAGAPRVIVAEPESAACVQAAIKAGEPVRLGGPLETAMAGLRCAEVSRAAWPWVRQADGCVTVSDQETFAAMARLARGEAGEPSILSGPSGACGVAALPRAAVLSGAGDTTRALAIITEGA
jgi:diaminopropionate ammonia-lyase